MLRSLFSGISGLRGHQQMMDVTGNNIANVNTTGFKSSQIQFQDALSQTIQAATAAGVNTAATNPAQIGLGMRVAGTSTNFTQGATQLTGRSTDMLVQGDGFFIVNSGGQQAYTRSGSFTFDAAGQMSTVDGSLVQGWMAAGGVVDPTGPLTALTVDATAYRGFSIGTDGTLSGQLDDGTTEVIGRVALANFVNPGGLEKVGNSLFMATVNSGAVQVGVVGENGTGNLVTNALEMSNVDLAQELTSLIIAQRGFQANSKVISTSDELLQDLMNLKR